MSIAFCRGLPWRSDHARKDDLSWFSSEYRPHKGRQHSVTESDIHKAGGIPDNSRARKTLLHKHALPCVSSSYSCMHTMLFPRLVALKNTSATTCRSTIYV